MSTAQLAVARATGDTPRTIRRHGFRLQRPLPVEPLDAVDCPACGQPILVVWPPAPGAVLECRRCHASFDQKPDEQVYRTTLDGLCRPSPRAYAPAA